MGKQYTLFDDTDRFLDPFKLSGDERMSNPVSWELKNKWSDGFYITKGLFNPKSQTLIKINENIVQEAFDLKPLVKGKDLLCDRREKLYFFSKDCSGHWFMVPKEKKNLWNHVCEMDEDDPKTWVAYEQFEQYRLGGGIEGIYFTPENNEEENQTE